MSILYRFFITRMFQSMLRSLPYVLVLLVAADKLGWNVSELIYVGLPVAAPFLGIFAGISQVSSNLAWLLSIPISKARLYLLHLSLVVSIVVMFCIWGTVVVTFYAFYKASFHLPDMGLVAKVWKSIDLSFTSGGPVPLIEMGSVAAAIFALIGMVLMITPQRVPTVAPSISVASKRKRQIRALLFFTAICVFGVVEEYVLAPWILVTVLLLSPAGALGRSRMALAFPRTSYRRAVQGAFIVGILTSLGLYAVGQSRYRSNEAMAIAEGRKFLGPWGGPVSAQRLGLLLQENLDTNSVRELGMEYRTRFQGGDRIPAGVAKEVDFRKGLFSKKSDSALVAYLGLFDPKSLSFSDVESVLDAARAHSIRGYLDGPAYWMISAPLSSVQTILLLQSPNPRSKFFALLRSRYFRDPSIAQSIWKEIRGLDDGYRNEALLTLSILNGRKIGMDELFDYFHTGHAQNEFPKPDCSRFAGMRMSSMSSADEGALNICVRQAMADSATGRILDLEKEKWIDLPLNEHEEALLVRALSIKRE